MNKRAQRNSIIRKIIRGVPYIVALALGALCTIYAIRLNKLKHDYVVTSAIISSFSADYRGTGGTVSYEFRLEGKIHKGATGYPDLNAEKASSLIGKIFPLVYEKGKVNNNKILIFPDRFKPFNLSFPDSLEWVKSYSRY
ncbi:hypothetical protein [Chitinophaga eiseniae]|uniref:hypothetical protein n=1 Tax=Chitinophaga eiseniae TaxID=634771 RepID=UPI00099A0BE9|nr:hypothetical protein [Chitinophaga eiseniae]